MIKLMKYLIISGKGIIDKIPVIIMMNPANINTCEPRPKTKSRKNKIPNNKENIETNHLADLLAI
jgi:hypothetical protein